MLFIHCQHWNSYLISQNTLILALFNKHWNSYLIFPHVRILVLFLETLESWPYPSKHWNCGPILMHIGILTSSFETLKPCQWNSYLILTNVEILTLFLHLNSGPILTNIGILILSFHCKHWNSGLILPNKRILPITYTHCSALLDHCIVHSFCGYCWLLLLIYKKREQVP